MSVGLVICVTLLPLSWIWRHFLARWLTPTIDHLHCAGRMPQSPQLERTGLFYCTRAGLSLNTPIERAVKKRS